MAEVKVKHEHQLNVALTNDEWAWVTRMAEKNGVPRQHIMRHLIRQAAQLPPGITLE